LNKENFIKLLRLYKTNLKFEDYYYKIIENMKKAPDKYTGADNFLMNLPVDKNALKIEYGSCHEFPNNYPIRIDVPVWFGDFEKSKVKILVYGREPRNTDEGFNIETIDKQIYAAPFGCDRWNANKIENKIKKNNIYFYTFKNLIENDKIFTIFSDIVKYYEIISNNTGDSDKNARRMFKKRATENLTFLEKEINLINPKKIILVGKAVYDFYEKNHSYFGNYKYIRIRHPAHGGHKEAKVEVDNLLKSLKMK